MKRTGLPSPTIAQVRAYEAKQRAKRKRLPLIGRRGRRELEAKREFRAALIERSGGFCEVAEVDRLRVCGTTVRHRGLDAHHVVLRSRGGTDDVANGLFICRNAHMFAHSRPEYATALGLMASAAEVPSITTGRQVT